MLRRCLRVAAVVFLLVESVQPCAALNIFIDYTHDAFFASHLPAKNALEQAAADLEAAITTTLGATTDTSVGTFSSATVTFDFSLSYENPTTETSVSVGNATLPADEFRVYAGMRALDGLTLGVGGPGGWGVSRGWSYSNPSHMGPAVSAAAAAADANMSRDDGPVIFRSTNSIEGHAYSFDVGSTLGSVTFDRDTNNDDVIDSEAQIQAFWHFDHTTAVAAGKNDFYSVALHELLHALGIGGSQSWDDKLSGFDDWTGSEVIALHGTGNNVVYSGDSSHIASGLMSTRLSDGGAQEAVMDPDVTVGTRKKLTLLDLAFLRDIGWDTVTGPVAVPGDFDDDTDVDANDINILADMLFRGASDPGGNDSADLDGVGGPNQNDMDYMVSTILGTVFGDADLDDDVDGADFDRWRIRDSLGGGIGWGTGDWDGDNDVDGADFDHWRLRLPAIGGAAHELAAWGLSAWQMYGTGSGPPGMVVPEPSTFILLSVALPAMVIVHRRRRLKS